MGLRGEGRGRFWRDGDEREPMVEREPTLIEVIEKAGSRITTGFVIAGAIIGLAVYSRPSPPHYDAVIGANGKVVRIDTRTGAMLTCDGGFCQSILRPGQHLERAPKDRPAPPLPPPAATQPALPAPAARPAPSAQPTTSQPTAPPATQPAR